MKERKNEWMKERKKKRKEGRKKEWKKEKMNEWMNECHGRILFDEVPVSLAGQVGHSFKQSLSTCFLKFIALFDSHWICYKLFSACSDWLAILPGTFFVGPEYLPIFFTIALLWCPGGISLPLQALALHVRSVPPLPPEHPVFSALTAICPFLSHSFFGIVGKLPR